MAITTTQLWQKWSKGLVDLLTTGQFDPQNQLIAFAGQSLVIDVASANPKVNNQGVYSVGNTVPAWSPSYAPHSALCTTYSLFLDWIDLKGDANPNLDPLLSTASQALTAAQNNFTDNVQPKAIAGFTSYKVINPDIDFPTYVQTQYPVYLDAQKTLTAARSQYNKLMTQKYGAGFTTLQAAQDRVGYTGGALDITAQNQFNMGVAAGSLAPAGSTSALPGETPPPTDTKLLESWAPAYTLGGFTKVYQEWQTKSANNQVDVGPIEVSGSTYASKWSEFGWSAGISGSFAYDFISVFASGSTSGVKSSFNEQSSQFKLSVSYTGLQAFPISPFSWFDLGLVQTYKDQLKDGAPTFFGADGSMALLPYEAIIGFEPKIELSLDNQDYQSMKLSWQAKASASIGIGPFRIGSATVSTYGNKGEIQYNDDSSTITIGPIKSTMPLLLGVIASKL